MINTTAFYITIAIQLLTIYAFLAIIGSKIGFWLKAHIKFLSKPTGHKAHTISSQNHF